MALTKRELISRVRSSLNEVSGDTHFTNRYIWSALWTGIKTIIKQDDRKRSVYQLSGVWQSICVKMEPVSPIMCTCLKLPLDCVLFRSTYKLPKILESSNGFVYRFISSPDMSIDFTLVTPYDYDKKSKIKYNKQKYAFLHDGYLWTPNAQFPLLLISGLFEDATVNLSHFNCDEIKDESGGCGSILDTPAGCPDGSESNVIAIALQELGGSKQQSKDEHPNSNESQKQVSP